MTVTQETARAQSPFSRFAMRCHEALLALVDAAVRAMHFRADPATVLVVRPDAIGDFVLWIDAAKALAAHFHSHGRRVVLLADSSWAAWVAEMCIFDEVMPFHRRAFRRNVLYRFQLGRRLRALGASLALHAPRSRTFEFGDAVMHVCGAPRCVGFVADGWNISPAKSAVSDRWYTDLVPFTPDAMEIVANAELVRAVTGESYAGRVADLRAHAAEHAPRCLRELNGAESYFVLFPGASFAGKAWPVDRFAATADALQRQTGWRGVICGGPDDSDVADALQRAASAPMLNWVGQTTLRDLAHVLAGARLLVSNDSSAVHIAAAVGTPAVCVLGGGIPGRFLPYRPEQLDARPLPVSVVHPMDCFGCSWRCIYATPAGRPHPCVDHVAVESVLQAVEQFIGLAHPAGSRSEA